MADTTLKKQKQACNILWLVYIISRESFDDGNPGPRPVFNCYLASIYEACTRADS